MGEERIDVGSLGYDLVDGLAAPCPARVSMRMRCGFGPIAAACNAAAYLKLCPGTTRSSVSAVVTMIAG
jgi:hypothetical protein